MKLAKAKHLSRTYGRKYLLSVMASNFLRKLGFLDQHQLIKEKIRIDASMVFQNQVAYGPFKGMLLSEETWWGKYDVLTKLLGQYEDHVLREIAALSQKFSHFIDIGAADGYYAIGVLKGKLFPSATAFEISEKGREVIAINAALNVVGDALSVRGEADALEIRKVVEAHGPSVVLCDIEGAEFSLLDDDTLRALQECAVIIELHDGFIRGLKGRRERLVESASKYFDVSYIQRSAPEVNAFPELAEWNDDMRMLAFSEGRPVRMDWLLFMPKTTGPRDF